MFGFAGRIIDEPERLETSNGVKLCRLHISVDKTGKDKDEQSEIYEVTVFRNLADENYQVGQYVAVNGKLMPNNYDKEGTLYYNSKLVGNSVTFIG